jgi:type II secretory pathway pseudopilin PulG
MVGSKAKDRTKGFTLLELFIITIIVAILAFVGWRSYKVSQDIQRETTVRLNMRLAQVAAKSYFNDSGGNYPPSCHDPAFLSYFPGGSCDQKGTRIGNYPINPFTNRPEAPQAGHVTDVDRARSAAPNLLGDPGQIFYTPIAEPGSDQITSFAIQGADRSGRTLGGQQANTSLVLSNH